MQFYPNVNQPKMINPRKLQKENRRLMLSQMFIIQEYADTDFDKENSDSDE